MLSSILLKLMVLTLSFNSGRFVTLFLVFLSVERDLRLFNFIGCFGTLDLLHDLKIQFTVGRLWLDHKFVLYSNRHSKANIDHDI